MQGKGKSRGHWKVIHLREEVLTPFSDLKSEETGDDRKVKRQLPNSIHRLEAKLFS